MTEAVHCERIIQAPASEAFRAFTHATALRDWFCNDALTHPHPGVFLFLSWNDGYSVICPITQFDPPHELSFEWNSPQDPGSTRVRVRFTPEGDGVRVEVGHTGFGEGAAWEQNRKEKARAWEASLENLESILLEGVDLRLARRPRLGIWMDDLTPEKANELGLPKTEGVLLAGTAPGTGAEAAGLVRDDVLVSLNGVSLSSPDSFRPALEGLKAGDRPLVEYYRDGEKLSTPLELSRFPIGILPENPAALAEEVRQTNARILADLREQTSSLTDTQAARRPNENEWSVRELIGHFILMERDYQSWAADMLQDNVVGDDLQMRPNVDERIGALLERLPLLAEALAELALAQEETAVLLEHLPENFVTWRKHLYRRLVDWEREVIPGHLDEEHAHQLTETIGVARK